MNQQKLQQILDKHKLWLDGKPGGDRADLYRANLSGADLRGANLSHADAERANFQGANLQGANLRGSNLQGTNLQDAQIEGVNLRGAILYRTNLSRADLRGADLRRANLIRAYLRDAQIEGTKFPKFQIPQNKTLYVYKKLSNGEIAHLRIPRTARRTATPLGNKCRAERAFVLKIVDQNGNEVSEGRSIHDSNFVYKVGETVSVPDYNPDIRVECTSGIHFFMTEEEAKKY